MGEAIKAPFQVIGGLSRRASLRSQARAREYEANIADLRAAQISQDRRRELDEALDTIEVVRAGRNLDPDSPTALAFERRAASNSFEAEDREVLGERFRGVALRTEARENRKAGTAALVAGVGEALASLSTLIPGKG